MFERFTDRARKVMAIANQEAQRFNHEYIGTEHLLLGLVKEGSGVGAQVLKGLGVDLRRARLEVEKLVKSGPDMTTMGKLPHTPRAKKVFEYAIEESRNLGNNYVGTEHLLLGLLREESGIGAQVLTNLGVGLEQTRENVRALVGADKEKEETGAESGALPNPLDDVAVLVKTETSFADLSKKIHEGLDRFVSARRSMLQMLGKLGPGESVANLDSFGLSKVLRLYGEMEEIRRTLSLDFERMSELEKAIKRQFC